MVPVRREEVASIGLRAVEGRVVLTYRHRWLDEDWEDLDELVPIAWTPCHFGGARP